MRHLGLLLGLLVATAVGCGSSASSESDAGASTAMNADSPSRFKPATSADTDAMFEAWCDWDVRCTKNYPVENCAERRRSMTRPAAYAAGAMADLAACFATLSCDAYEDRCVGAVASDLAKTTPSRTEFQKSCDTRAGQCTGEGELSPLVCYWMTLSSDLVFAQVQACMAKPCDKTMDCLLSAMD
jgi:hypothetical protein